MLAVESVKEVERVALRADVGESPRVMPEVARLVGTLLYFLHVHVDAKSRLVAYDEIAVLELHAFIRDELAEAAVREHHLVDEEVRRSRRKLQNRR